MKIKRVYHFVFDVCRVNKNTNTFIWKVKAGREHNKKTFFYCFIITIYLPKLYWMVSAILYFFEIKETDVLIIS